MDNMTPAQLRAEADKLERGRKKKLEFSQKFFLTLGLFAMFIVFLVHMGNFILLWNSRMPMTQEVLSTVQTFGGIVATMAGGGYAALNAIRDTSLNKTHRVQMAHIKSSAPVIKPASQNDIHDDRNNTGEENDA